MKEKKIQKLAGYVDIASRVYPELAPIGDELRRLHAENEELRRDALRYRGLKSTAGFGIRRNGVTELSVAFFEYQPDHMSELDAAIDAAMKDK